MVTVELGTNVDGSLVPTGEAELNVPLVLPIVAVLAVVEVMASVLPIEVMGRVLCGALVRLVVVLLACVVEVDVSLVLPAMVELLLNSEAIPSELLAVVVDEMV